MNEASPSGIERGTRVRVVSGNPSGRVTTTYVDGDVRVELDEPRGGKKVVCVPRHWLEPEESPP